MKNRLYYQDAYIHTFEAEVVHRGLDENSNHYVILSNTAFYPTGGGQPCDLGTLNDVKVVGVEVVEGEIYHYLEKPLPDEEQHVFGVIDWDRRFDHMQQHAGQHILSAAFQDLFGYKTVSFHLGKESVTIDLQTPNVSKKELEVAFQKANEIVFHNEPILTKWVEPDELSHYPLRKPPKVTEDIRLVIIEGVDYNACGGTHPRRTGEVGPIQLLGTERMKDNVRISFLCGWRAIKAFQSKHDILRRLTHSFNRPEEELYSTIEQAFHEQNRLKAELANVMATLLDQEAISLIESAEGLENGCKLIARFYIDRPLQELQQLSHSIKDHDPNTIILLTVLNENKLQLIASRGKDVSQDMNKMVKSVLPLINGRGGGKADHAQGGGEAVMTASALLEHLKRAIIGKEAVL
ncbi:DHHA1 domain-containing protein [Pullulanibacillus sp. KACC 23026]|uniref:alanyl-tRNA editing protein n=1 Tax=Pullulanibacillus sp. KACC 23026 TaxID=3028315 RepID=UPI0023B1279F|nr:DHHA1 domain-containing protein [Pullulanibacillus sp. KACC 23026]WEG10843.1 DHHA1 domain-containing protein [Pullulanibacillus sp. KACC 23026]